MVVKKLIHSIHSRNFPFDIQESLLHPPKTPLMPFLIRVKIPPIRVIVLKIRYGDMELGQSTREDRTGPIPPRGGTAADDGFIAVIDLLPVESDRSSDMVAQPLAKPKAMIVDLVIWQI